MKRAFNLLLLAAFSFSVTAQQLSKEQKIERILDLTSSDALIEVVVGQVRSMLEQIQVNPTPQQKAKRQEALDKIAKLAKERLQKVRPAMVQAYSETFTDAEIDGLLAWYSSPVGRSSTQKLPTVGARISGITQTEMNTLNDEINKIAEDSLKR
jgi:uncharacterized protein